jgi:hypothetical protein
LYVIAAEVLTTPDAAWRSEKLTKRFVAFFSELIPSELDRLIAHNNFEEAFGVRRGQKKASTLRRLLLETIYDLRSGLVHSGLQPSYRGITSGFGLSSDMRRALLYEFVESAFLAYLQSPRSSVVGHPGLDISLRP